jgi:hypothetical protein
VVIAPASRIVKKRAKTERQESWWASCSQGFESLPRRQQQSYDKIPDI